MSLDVIKAPSMVSNTSSDTLVDNNQGTGLPKLPIDEFAYDDEADEKERLLLSIVEPSRTRSIWRKALALCKAPSGIIIGLCGLLLILLLSVAASFGDDWDAQVQDGLSSLQEKVSQSIQKVSNPSQSTCEDPWETPGYIWYGDHRFDARWVPYNAFPEDILRKNASKLFDPESTDARAGNNAPHEDQLPVHLTKLFSQKKVRTNNSDLEFLRNKHIVVLGSSMDREATMMFCHAYEGAARPELEMHHSLRCRFPDYNLTISQWMHFGMGEAPWFHGGDKVSKAITFEDRVDQIFTSMAEKEGKPDLLVFTSGFWDLQYLDAHLKKIDKTHPLGLKYQPVRPDQLKWHRARLVKAIQHLRARFPDSFLMYRTTTEPDGAWSSADEEATAVFQLNQSARKVMQKFKIPLFHWAELVKGNHEHRDVHHFNTVSRAHAVYHEMLFWHLKQVTSQADTSCWLKR